MAHGYGQAFPHHANLGKPGDIHASFPLFVQKTVFIFIVSFQRDKRADFRPGGHFYGHRVFVPQNGFQFLREQGRIHRRPGSVQMEIGVIEPAGFHQGLFRRT